jgi:hypothetical protein
VRVGGPSDAALAIFPPLKLPEAHYRCLFSRDGMRRPRGTIRRTSPAAVISALTRTRGTKPSRVATLMAA